MNKPIDMNERVNPGTLQCSLLSLGCIFGFVPLIEISWTAFRALKVAQRRLRADVRSELLCIASPRTDATLIPQAWRFVFRDLRTIDHARVVTVGAKASSEHPDVVEAFASVKEEDAFSLQAIDRKKLVVDSDQALEKVRGISKLNDIQGAEYRLVQPQQGGEPRWDLSFYGKAAEPVASFHIGAKTGAVARGGQWLSA